MSLASDGIWATCNLLGWTLFAGQLLVHFTALKARDHRHPRNIGGRVLRAHGVSQWRWYGEGARQPLHGRFLPPVCCIL